MSSRIRYTPDGFRRKMLISKDSALFVVVEGRNSDQWFYEKVFESSPKLRRVGYQVWRVESFKITASGNFTGGKDAVLALRTAMNARSSLTLNSSGVKKSIMFCIDADHDRLTKTTIKCRHTTYTLFPDTEAHIMDSCNLQAVLSDAMSLPKEDATKLLEKIGDYRGKLAEKWAEWIMTCCLRGRTGSSSGPKPGTPGTAIKGNYQKITRTDTLKARKSILENCITTGPRSKEIILEIETDIRMAVSNGESRTLLKGKWLADFLQHEANKYAERNEYKKISNSDQIHAAARSHATFDTRWVTYFKKRAIALV